MNNTTTENQQAAEQRYAEYRDAASAMILADTPGFWLCAAPITSVDMAIASSLERARFYEGCLPKEARERLFELEKIGDGREAEVAASMARAFDKTDELFASRAPMIAWRSARRKASREPLRDSAGASFTHFQPATPGSHWGTLVVFYDETLYLPSRHSCVEYAGADVQALAQEANAFACEAILDELEKHWGLAPPIFVMEPSQGSIWWGTDCSCTHGAPDRSALERLSAASEARALAAASAPATATPKRAPSL